jgi:hypothetical protein
MSEFRVRATRILLNAASSEDATSLGLEVGFSAEDEAADVVELTYQLQDAAGVSVAEEWTGKLSILDGNAEPYGDALAFEADVTTGTAETAVTRPIVVAASDASGTLVFDVTDVVGASGTTVYVEMRANVGGHYSVESITFD